MADDEFLDSFKAFLERVNERPTPTRPVTPLGRIVQEHLGIDLKVAPLVTEEIAPHRLVDADIAMESIAGENSRLIGVAGGQQREHESFPGLLSESWVRFDAGPVDYQLASIGPSSERRIVSFGLRLFEWGGHRFAVLQRGTRPEFGRQSAKLEVLAESAEQSGAILTEIRRRMLELSVLRGQLVTFAHDEYRSHGAGVTFVDRPTVAADEVILPDGVLDSVVRHVVGIGEQREALKAAGRHLKRGVLLYGPPGTGKTLTVRHLLARTPGTTAVLLTGPSIQFISTATDLARAMQPSIVVLEDIDLVASERGMHGPQPLLFAVLDALDGLDGDADVTFLMTTNRVELLERALAERPGRVDLAVEVPLPDRVARRRLFALYGASLGLSETALQTAADRALDVTASFAKELMRRVVLIAAEESHPVSDADLSTALDGLLSDRESLTRSLLGSGGPRTDTGSAEGAGPSGSFGWTSYS